MKLFSCFGKTVVQVEKADYNVSEVGASPPVLETCPTDELTSTTPARFLSAERNWRVASPQDQPLLSHLTPGSLTPVARLGEGAYGRVELCRVSVQLSGITDGNGEVGNVQELSHDGTVRQQAPTCDDFVVVRPGRFSVRRLRLQLSPQGNSSPLSTCPRILCAGRRPSSTSAASRTEARWCASHTAGALGLQSPSSASAGQPLTPVSPGARRNSEASPPPQGFSCSLTDGLPASSQSSPSRSLHLHNELVVAVKRIEYRGVRGRCGADGPRIKGAREADGADGIQPRQNGPHGPSRLKLSRMQAIELLQLARCRECPFIVRVFGCVPEEPRPASSGVSPHATSAQSPAAATTGGLPPPPSSSSSCRIVMEWAEGGDLGCLLKRLAARRNPCSDGSFERLLMTENSARFYIGCLLEGLAFLHGKHLLHRDVKPANLLLASDGRAKLGDLGMVCHLDQNGCAAGRAGTPNYMAPEVWAHGTSTKYSCYRANVDLWSTGVVLYEMLTGHLPASHPDEYLRPSWRLTRYHPAFSSELRDLLAHLICSKPRRRLQTCADVMTHAWFAGFDWQRLRDGSMPAPYVPSEHRPICAAAATPTLVQLSPQSRGSLAGTRAEGAEGARLETTHTAKELSTSSTLRCGDAISDNTAASPRACQLLLTPDLRTAAAATGSMRAEHSGGPQQLDTARATLRSSCHARLMAGTQDGNRVCRSPCPRYGGPRDFSGPSSPAPAAGPNLSVVGLALDRFNLSGELGLRVRSHTSVVGGLQTILRAAVTASAPSSSLPSPAPLLRSRPSSSCLHSDGGSTHSTAASLSCTARGERLGDLSSLLAAVVASALSSATGPSAGTRAAHGSCVGTVTADPPSLQPAQEKGRASPACSSQKLASTSPRQEVELDSRAFGSATAVVVVRRACTKASSGRPQRSACPVGGPVHAFGVECRARSTGLVRAKQGHAAPTKSTGARAWLPAPAERSKLYAIAVVVFVAAIASATLSRGLLRWWSRFY